TVTWDAINDVPREATGGIGCFFSGGLDSFYTYLNHETEIDTLVFVHGLDIWLDDQALRQQVSDDLQTISAVLGKRLIQVETNLREFTDQFLDYGLHCCGGALASVALLLSNQLRKIFVPSSEDYAHLAPWGSHPMLDPLWGTERLEIVHDGLEANRVEKANRVSQSDLALAHLRVCYQNLHEKRNYSERPEKWNCGHCEKCLRTMLNLYIAGTLDRCPTFRSSLSPELIRQSNFSNESTIGYMEENLLHLKEKEGDTALTRALAEYVEDYRRRRVIHLMAEQSEVFFSSAPWVTFADERRNTLFKSLRSVWGSWMTRESIKEDLKRFMGRPD
ncbi:MAG: hypothetical protein ACLPXB_10840, partial [Thiobacillaceae bacterium]